MLILVFVKWSTLPHINKLVTDLSMEVSVTLFRPLFLKNMILWLLTYTNCQFLHILTASCKKNPKISVTGSNYLL